jgi:ABC-type antimicrobial peptide transport system permease subunit
MKRFKGILKSKNQSNSLQPKKFNMKIYATLLATVFALTANAQSVVKLTDSVRVDYRADIQAISQNEFQAALPSATNYCVVALNATRQNMLYIDTAADLGIIKMEGKIIQFPIVHGVSKGGHYSVVSPGRKLSPNLIRLNFTIRNIAANVDKQFMTVDRVAFIHQTSGMRFQGSQHRSHSIQSWSASCTPNALDLSKGFDQVRYDAERAANYQR